MTEKAASALERRLIELTRELVLIPGTVNRPEDRRRCLRFIRYHLEANGPVEIREYEDGGYTSLLALAGGVEHPEVLLCGHLDVVALSEDAVYDASIEGGRIVGPGVADMKGPLAILIDLFLALLGEDPARSIGLLITSDEEQGGEHGVRHLLMDRGLRCGLALIPDGGSPGEITVEEKGILQIQVESRGNRPTPQGPGSAGMPLNSSCRGTATSRPALKHWRGKGAGGPLWR